MSPQVLFQACKEQAHFACAYLPLSASLWLSPCLRIKLALASSFSCCHASALPRPALGYSLRLVARRRHPLLLQTSSRAQGQGHVGRCGKLWTAVRRYLDDVQTFCRRESFRPAVAPVSGPFTGGPPLRRFGVNQPDQTQPWTAAERSRLQQLQRRQPHWLRTGHPQTLPMERPQVNHHPRPLPEGTTTVKCWSSTSMPACWHRAGAGHDHPRSVAGESVQRP